MRSSSTGRHPTSVAGWSGSGTSSRKRPRLVREACQHLDRIAPECERSQEHRVGRLGGGPAPVKVHWLRAATPVLYLRPRMPPRTSRAIVQTGPRQLELRELPVPALDRRHGAAARRGVRHLRQRRRAVHRHDPGAVSARSGARAARRDRGHRRPRGQALGGRRRRPGRRRVAHPVRPLRRLPERALPGVPGTRRHVRARLRAAGTPAGAVGRLRRLHAPRPILHRAPHPGRPAAEHRGAVQPARGGLPLGRRAAAHRARRHAW